jgi:CDP-diacylglycerol--glycerol-3-phosphate 3-phosphatidyltransferase
MTLATQITVARIALVPVFAGLAVAYGQTVAQGQPVDSLRWAALAVFITAAASDGLDGWIARHFNQRSKLGAFLDPIADKSLMLTAVITLWLVGWGDGDWHIPWWFATLVILRDVIILCGIRILQGAHRKVAIRPHWTGKYSTFFQMFALGWVMLKVVPFSPVYPALVASLFTVWSMIEYIRRGIHLLRDPQSAA